MVRFTDLHCTIDTHISPRTQEEAQAVADELLRLVTEELNTRQGYQESIPVEEDGKLRSVTMLNASVEMGEKYKRIHIHYNLSIVHETKVLLKDANRRLQDWFNLHSPWGTECYAKVRLLDSSRAKNYNVKKGVYAEPVTARMETGEAGEDSV